MSEHERPWYDRAISGLGIAGDAADLIHNIHHIGHIGAATLGGQAATLEAGVANAGAAGGTALSNWLGPLALISGINNLRHADGSAEGIVHGAEGALQTTAGAIGTTGLVGAGLSAAGATGAGAALTGAAAAAAPVAAVAGAGALGLAVGSGMHSASDSEYTRTGFWGQDDSGRNRSAADWGSNWGNWVDENVMHTRPGDWSIPGAAAAMTGGIVGGIAGTAQAGWNATLGRLF